MRSVTTVFLLEVGLVPWVKYAAHVSVSFKQAVLACCLPSSRMATCWPYGLRTALRLCNSSDDLGKKRKSDPGSHHVQLTS